MGSDGLNNNIFFSLYKEFKRIIRQYLDNLRSLYPNAASKSITINSTTHENCFDDFCKSIENFDNLDFIHCPFIRARQE